VQAAEDTGVDRSTGAAGEVDRTLKGFEQTTRLQRGLRSGDESEAQLLAERSGAALGDRAGMVRLERFVTDAVWLDGGAVVGDIHDDVFE